jgi:hypothetical protein
MLYTEEDLQRSYAEGYNAACDELEAMIEESEYEFSLVQESKKHSKKDDDEDSEDKKSKKKSKKDKEDNEEKKDKKEDEEEDLTALESALLEAQK